MKPAADWYRPDVWHLPKSDTYFAPFIDAPNRFQLDHLLPALDRARSWGVAVDVGAHVGWWTVELARRFKRVLAFEASPKTFKCLTKNLQPFTNVEAFNLAVGDCRGVCQIRERDEKPDRKSVV